MCFSLLPTLLFVRFGDFEASTMANLVLASPCKQRGRSPVADLHSCWSECSEKEKDSFDFEPWESDISEFLMLMMNSGCCKDLHNASRETKCLCMEELRDHITDLSYYLCKNGLSGAMKLGDGRVEALCCFNKNLGRPPCEPTQSVSASWLAHSQDLQECRCADYWKKARHMEQYWENGQPWSCQSPIQSFY